MKLHRHLHRRIPLIGSYIKVTSVGQMLSHVYLAWYQTDLSFPGKNYGYSCPVLKET